MTSRQEINHLVEMMMARMDQAVRGTFPKEFIVEVNLGEDGTTDDIIKYKLTVLDYAGQSTSWRHLKLKFDAAVALNPSFKEVRVTTHGDNILLCGVTLLDDKP